MSSMFTVVIRPSPKGLSREELTSLYLKPCGEVQGLRFGLGKHNDYLSVDFATPQAALKAVKKLDGEKYNGHVKCSATLSQASAALMEKVKPVADQPIAKRQRPLIDHVVDVKSFGSYKQSDVLVYKFSSTCCVPM